MRVLIANNMAPFVWGGAEALAESLADQLRQAGHDAELLRIPFSWEPVTRLPSQMLMVRAIELRNVDRVVALKFPAYLIRHPAKTVWLLHQFRQAYDLREASHSRTSADPLGDEIRGVIAAADAEAFGEARRIFTNSDVTRDRLRRYSGLDAEVLRPPLNDAGLFTGGNPQGYVFAGGRVNAMKRQHLLVEALALTPPAVRLVIAGPPDSSDDRIRIERLVEDLGLAPRVTLDLRLMPREEVARYVNGSTAVACIPYEEDSFSYVAMEAAEAGKAIITTRDSGGVLGLVRHRETGWVAEPTAASLADALSRVDGSLAVELGHRAKGVWTGLGISWPRTIERLLA